MKRMGREEAMTRRKAPMLSKSRFLAGLQCPLRLWFQCYNRELATPVSPSQQALFDQGNQVGRLATRIYPGGVLIEEDQLHHEEAVESTRAVLADPAVPAIFEAGFVYDSVRVRVDVLQRLRGGRWSLVEVKSSTSAKQVHEPDVAVQCYVLSGSGLEIARAGVLHLNSEYVYDGTRLDLERLFVFSDLTEEARAQLWMVEGSVREFKEMLAGEDPPRIEPGRRCMRPHRCEFWEHCTREKPASWVMNLSGIRQDRLEELAALGVDDIRDIPEGFPLTAVQDRMKACAASGEEFAAPELAAELADVDYPIHFLDFETVGPAVPLYAGTRPFQAIPFQWSDHILHANGTLEHREFLHEQAGDPRQDFCRTLVNALGGEGSIFVYTEYEARIMTSLAEDFPWYRDRLLSSLGRMKDLCAIVRAHYYHPAFRGSFSLKSVLPAVVPSMAYDELAIQEGNQASLEYLRMMDPSTSPEERAGIKVALLTYCGYDTLAMVRIREELLRRFG
jgi:predicted RecB family nuclease